MDTIVYFIIFFIVIIFLLKYGEKIIFNFLQSQKNKHFEISNSVETFESEVPGFSNNFDFVYTTLDGTYNILIDNNLWICKKNNKPIYSRKLPFKEKIKTGFYNNSKNEIVLLDTKNNLFIFDIKESKISEKIHIKSYFRNIKIKNIDCLFYLNGNVYIFDKDIVRIYNIKNEKLLICSKINKIFSELEGKTPDFVFLNFNDIKYKNPIPAIYLKCGGKIQIFSYENFDSFIRIKKNNKQIIDFSGGKNISKYGFKGEIVEHIFKKSGNYRIITIGAGNIGGGYGGMLFNDYFFNKDDKISILVGQSGTRIPVKKTAISDISENLKHILPLKGGCSGSGGSFIFKNNEVIQASGGGGGWCSEIVKPPFISSSNSLFKTKNKKGNYDYFFPVKKIIIETETTQIDDSYKIIIKNLDIESFSIDFVDIDVLEFPEYDFLDIKKKNKTRQYETGYTSYGDKAYIEITFSETLSDFKLYLDFEIKSYKNKFVNSKTYFYNELGENIRQIHNLNIHEEYRMPLTPYKLISNKEKERIKETKYDGYSIKKITDLFSYKHEKNEKKNLIKGGVGGGGATYFSKYTNKLICGGGGGYKGGNGYLSNINSTENYVCGTGGDSFIKLLNFSKENIKLLENCFVNNFNSKDGGVYIIEI